LNFSSSHTHPRLRALRNLAFAIVVVWFAPYVASLAAGGFSSGQWTTPLFVLFLVFLYVIVFGGMGNVLDGQARPFTAMGLAPRPGWGEEFALGGVVGWAMVVVVVGAIAVVGSLRVGFDHSAGGWAGFLVNLVTILLASLGEEVVYRGYPFQRLMEATSPFIAVLIASIVFGVRHAGNPDATPRSIAVTVFAGVVLSVAYLRTRALWLSWGLHFGWNFSLAAIFGLPMSGFGRYSSLVQTRARGPLWLTGGGYGPEASLTAAIVLFAGIWVVVRVTREYAWRYGHPEIIAGGIPVDIGGHPPVTAYPAPAAVAPEKPADESGLVQIQLK